ncbi:18S rRNA aminocarboxypropyltransferase-like [Monomorium pharaonis]|uniref:18S rRNA aminocarboxypropyltransferase-like n=1 Tax=Monomorium pharaonis TaxID=307658 RepID=UPI00063F576B|nr:18S rRNA aminocarboxypropyltransferase-like [Monomorium pharaonis]
MSGRRRKDKKKMLQRRPRYVLGKEQRYHQKMDRESEGSDKEDDDEAEMVDEWPLPFPVAMWSLERCNLKSTGRQLLRQGLTKLLRLNMRFPGLCLIPMGKKNVQHVTSLDRKIVEKYGCAVVDCSWSFSNDALFSKLKTAHPRILPYLFTADPRNFGKRCQLSCVEAIAATLIITGFPDEANLYLDKFRWGHSFLELNGELLEKYARCTSTEEVIAVQDKFIKDTYQEKLDRKQALPDFPQSDTETEEEKEKEDKDNSKVSEITKELANAKV